MLFVVFVYTIQYAPKGTPLLLKSGLRFPSTMVEGLNVFDTPFADGNTFNH